MYVSIYLGRCVALPGWVAIVMQNTRNRNRNSCRGLCRVESRREIDCLQSQLGKSDHIRSNQIKSDQITKYLILEWIIVCN